MSGTEFAFEMVALASDDSTTKLAIATIEENYLAHPVLSDSDLRSMEQDIKLERIKARNKIGIDPGPLPVKNAIPPGPGDRPQRKTPRNYADIRKNFEPPRPSVVKAIASFVEVPSAR